jgi:hypothetical protein
MKELIQKLMVNRPTADSPCTDNSKYLSYGKIPLEKIIYPHLDKDTSSASYFLLSLLRYLIKVLKINKNTVHIVSDLVILQNSKKLSDTFINLSELEKLSHLFPCVYYLLKGDKTYIVRET